MNDDIAISVRDVTKAYRIWDRPSSRLISPFMEFVARRLPRAARNRIEARSRRHYHDFYALRNVSFEVRRGEGLGIIGRNGSGKSTLLQIIAGTLQPSSGSVAVSGRVAALLELGSGFNPEFTGRENVFLNAAVLGLSEEQTSARFHDIEAFADIGEFIDQPVKTYSSGMVVRLAFAVAAHVAADVLIIDEALAVGDARFQLKCARAIDRFLENGVTMLFVSHDPSSIKRLCRTAVLLERGSLLYAGRPNDTINLYSKLIADGGSAESLLTDIHALVQRNEGGTEDLQVATGHECAVTPLPQSNATTLVDAATESKLLHLRIKALEITLSGQPESAQLLRKVNALIASERDGVQISSSEFSYGGELGRILSIEILDSEHQHRTWFVTGETIIARCVVQSHEHFPEPIFAMTIRNPQGVDIYGTNTLFSGQPAREIVPNEVRVVTFSFPIDLMPGEYFISFGFTHFFGDNLTVIHRRYDAVKIQVHGKDRTFGIANLRATIAEARL